MARSLPTPMSVEKVSKMRSVAGRWSARDGSGPPSSRAANPWNIVQVHGRSVGGQAALQDGARDQSGIQAAFQRRVDNAVSKTINLPQESTTEEIKSIYLRTWQYGLKGVTIYQYGSKDQQVFELGITDRPEELEHFARCDPHACKL